MTLNARGLLRQAAEAASAAATEPDRWRACVVALAAATGAAGAALFRPRPEPEAGAVALQGTMVADADAYWRHWVHLDPWNLAARGTDLFQRAGELRFGREFLSDAAYRRSAYYNELGRRRDSGHKLFLKVCDASDPVAPVTHFALSRSFRQQPFGTAERELLRRFWPHFRQAVQNHALLAGVRHAPQLAESALQQLPYPCWVLRADSFVEFANRSAETAMRAHGWLRAAAGRLVRVAGLDEAALRRLVADAAQGLGCHRLISYPEPGPGGLGRAAMRLAPIGESPLYAATWPQARALLLLELPVPREEDAAWIDGHVGAHYRLTPNECRVLELLVAGQEIPGIAEALGITQVTVRTHLRGLREKTGRRSQAALVRLGLGR